MSDDKSIDGLSTKAAKTKKRSKKSAKSTKSAKKTVTPEEFASTPDTNLWDSIIEDAKPEPKTPELIEEIDVKEEVKEEPIKKPVKKSTRPKRVDGFTPIKKEEKPLNFLKPVAAYDFDEEEGLTESEDTVEIMKSLNRENDKKNDEEDEEFEMTDKETKKKAKKEKKAQKKKKPVSKKRKVITITALVIVILLIGFVIWFILWGNDIIAKITGGRGNLFDLFTFTNETYDPLKTDKNGRTNILAIGTGGYNMDGDEGNGVHDGAQLTDSIMVISLDQKTGDVAMISLPRDLKGPATCTSTGKINEIYWCNGGSGKATIEEEEEAATAVMEAVGKILDIDIQYYAHLNWGSLASIVDLLGGITVTLDEDINDYQYTKAVFKAGTPYNINGAEAVGLARARHGTAGGDFSRGNSQQKILIGIKNKILEKSLSLNDILGLVNTLGDNLRTNFSVNELKTVAHMPEILDFDVMRQISLYPDYMTTGMLNGISYVLPKAGAGNYNTIQKFLAVQLSSDPRDYEEPTIAIYNASDTDGRAAEEKTKLEEKGYKITLIDNAPKGTYEEGVNIYAINSTKAGTKRLLEEEYAIDVKPKEELPATITPDYDFIIILNN